MPSLQPRPRQLEANFARQGDLFQPTDRRAALALDGNHRLEGFQRLNRALEADRSRLEIVPSDRIMWGADTINAEGIYAATEFTRQCLAEALAEKVERGELREEHAKHIGRQIMRDNALKLFPKLKRLLWR